MAEMLYLSAVRFGFQHRRLAKVYRTRARALGITNAMLGVLVGCGVITRAITSMENTENEEEFAMIVRTVSVVMFLLAALGRVLNYKDLIDRHRRAEHKFAKIQLQMVTVFINCNPQNEEEMAKSEHIWLDEMSNLRNKTHIAQKCTCIRNLLREASHATCLQFMIVWIVVSWLQPCSSVGR